MNKSLTLLALTAWGTAMAQADYPTPFGEGQQLDTPQLTKLITMGTRTRTYTPAAPLNAYLDFTGEKASPVAPGATLRLVPTGATFSALYVDEDNNGQFEPTELQPVATTYSPEATHEIGLRRARLIVGGDEQIIDFLIDIHASTITLDVDGQNTRFLGRKKYATPETTTPDETRGLPTTLAAYMDLGLTVEPVMDSGYACDSVYITYGYNLDGPQYVHGNRQWKTYRTTVKSTQQYALNIPRDYLMSQLRIRADFHPKAVCGFHQTFIEEFNQADGEDADPTKWRTSIRQGAAWNRFISPSLRVAHTEGGQMVMKCMKRPTDVDDTAEYISGAKDTRGKFSFTHGYVEARILTTPHTGNFPAFWLMPDDQADGWPTCGEIDIWETINGENRAYQTVHSNWTYNLGRTGNPQSAFNRYCKQDGEYHYYGLRKEENLLAWYVDGQQVCTYTNLKTDDSNYHKQWPFEKKFYIIINQSVGTGSWAAAPDPNFVYTTRFDNVRCYQSVTELEHDDNPDPVSDLTTSLLPAEPQIYDLNGRRLPELVKGINIVRYADGTVRKVMK